MISAIFLYMPILSCQCPPGCCDSASTPCGWAAGLQKKGYFLLLTSICLLMVFQYCLWIFFPLSHTSHRAPQATHICRWAGGDLSECNKTQMANYKCLSQGSQVMTACCQKYLYQWVCCSLCPLYSFIHLF